MGKEGLPEEASAYAGKKHDGIEIAREETPAKIENLFIVFQRHLAHGGGDDRLAALFANQRGHFLGSAAFERKNSETVKRHLISPDDDGA